MYLSNVMELNTSFYCLHGKCSKILNTFSFLFLNKIFVIRAGIVKMYVRMANREDHDQLLLRKQSDQGLPCCW